MNRDFSENMTFLEGAKAGIEQFFRCEHRKAKKASCYILVTYDKDPIKSFSTEKELLNTLGALKAKDLSNASHSLAALFDFLSVKRIVETGDVSGKGRYPGSQETVMIFWITDATSFTTSAGVTDKINIPGLKTVGADTFLEPFRWEQRLYTIGLTTDPNFAAPHIGVMSDAVGGQFWLVHSVKQMVQCIENCHGLAHPKRHLNIQPVHPICHIEGVSVVLESHPANQTSFQPARMFIYANQTVTKHFPLPENFWPGQFQKENGQFGRFPPRNAQPTFFVSTKDEIHRIYEGLPCDRFSIEQSHLLSQLLKRPRGTCWTVFAKNSYHKHGMGYPFGFFRVSNTGKLVNLYILPYNFPKLFKILTKLAALKDQPPTSGLLLQLSDYMREIPAYYVQPTLKALEAIQMDHVAHALPIDSIVTNLAKHWEKVIQQATIAMIQYQSNLEQKVIATTTKNIYDVPVMELENELKKIEMASKEKQTQLTTLTQEELDLIHSVPISEMGDFTKVMNKIEVPRNPLEEEEERREREKGLFGNPYRKQKKTTASLSKSDQDSVMESVNEMEEEGTHEFSDELKNGSTNRKRTLVAAKQEARKRIPPLSKQTVLLVPDFDELTWSSLRQFDFNERISKLQAQHTVVPLVEEVQKDHILEPTLIVESDAESLNLTAPDEAEFVPISPMSDENEWLHCRKRIYDLISEPPRAYDESTLINLIQSYFEQNKNVPGKRLDWVRHIAKAFRRRNIEQFLKTL